MILSSRVTMRPGLFQAVSCGHYKQTRYILESGLNPNIKGDDGYTALVQALHLLNEVSRDRMVRLLLRCGASVHSVDTRTGRDVLIWACALDRPREVKRIVENGRGALVLNRSDKEGNTALHYAVRHGNLEIAELLCLESAKFGIAVDVPNRDGFTPYLLACRHGYSECARILIHIGHASKNQCDRKHFRPADYWTGVGHREVRKRQKEQLNGLPRDNGQEQSPDQMSIDWQVYTLPDSEQVNNKNGEKIGQSSENGPSEIDSRSEVKSSDIDENGVNLLHADDILPIGRTLPRLHKGTRLPSLHGDLTSKLALHTPFPCTVSLPQLKTDSSSTDSLDKYAVAGSMSAAASFPGRSTKLADGHDLTWLKPTCMSTPAVHLNPRTSQPAHSRSQSRYVNQKQRDSVINGLIPMLEILSSQKSTSYRRHVKPLPNDFRSLAQIIGVEASTIEYMKKPEETETSKTKGKRKNGRAFSKNSKTKIRVQLPKP